jgi:hypothetical protein
MTNPKNQSRTGRPPSGDVAKKVVSLTIDPALIKRVDDYAADKKISRSAAIEIAITELLALNRPAAMVDNSLVQPDTCIFASPTLSAAIHY